MSEHQPCCEVAPHVSGATARLCRTLPRRVLRAVPPYSTRARYCRCVIVRSLQIVAGFEVMRVHTLLRRIAHDFWTEDDVVREMKITPPRAAALIAALRSADYVEHAPSQPKGVWRNPVAGNALASATAATSILRQTGEDRLAQFLERVQALNANDECAYRVTKVVLFGSYLTSKTRLSDVDLAIRLEPRPKY